MDIRFGCESIKDIHSRANNYGSLKKFNQRKDTGLLKDVPSPVQRPKPALRVQQCHGSATLSCYQVHLPAAAVREGLHERFGGLKRRDIRIFKMCRTSGPLNLLLSFLFILRCSISRIAWLFSLTARSYDAERS